jgi:hypothetical protein
MKNTSYELQFGRPPKVSHFLGYVFHSHAYCVLNLETNQVVETYEVTFNEIMPCSSPIFECVGDQEIGESIFVEEEQEDVDWGDTELTPPAAPLEPAMSTSAHSPDPSSSTTWGPCEQPPQPTSAAPKEAPAAVEGEVTSSREAPRHI